MSPVAHDHDHDHDRDHDRDRRGSVGGGAVDTLELSDESIRIDPSVDSHDERRNVGSRLVRWLVLGPVIVVVVVGAAVIGLSRISPQDRPSLFGFEFLVVTSGSMEPVLSPGDLVIVDRDDDDDRHEVGDLVVFRRATGMLVTHRIVAVARSSDGSTSYVTRGDANDSVDSDPVAPDQVIGEVSASVPLLGRLLFGTRRPAVLMPVFAGLVLFELGSRLRRPDDATFDSGYAPSRSTDRDPTSNHPIEPQGE